MNIASILHDQAVRIGDQPAIVERGRTISFAGLDRAAHATANELSDSGVRPGMRAIVLSPMSITLYTTVIALFRLQVTAVFVDPSGGRARLDACLRRVRPNAFIARPRAHLLRLTSAAIRAIPIKLTIDGRVPFARTVGRQLTAASSTAISPCAAGTPAVITFTSGSTGEPKAVVRTHGFLIAQHHALVESLALKAGDVDLTTLPIFVLANLASGVTSVIPDADLRAPGAIDPAAVLAQIRTTRPTRTVASPAFLDRLARGAVQRQACLTTFQHVFTGGAPVFPKDLDALADIAPQAAIVAVYGSTEAEPIAHIDRRDIAVADRTAMQQGAGLLTGQPEPSLDVRILRDRWGTACGPWDVATFDRQSLGHGEAGEIVVAGDHVLTGYLDGQGDAETKIKVGDRVWHRTGDAGYLDRRGRLWLLGRCAERVSDKAGVAYPFAVECAASDVPGVERSAFVQHRGRRVLVVQAERTSGAPRAALMERLSWVQLAEIIMMPRIPVDGRHNAKVDYPALRRMLESRIPQTSTSSSGT